jgi:uncharacterized protein with PIN domain
VDAPASIRILNADWGEELSAEVLERAGTAIDLEAETAICPACGDSLEPASGRCPGCGLRLF